MSAGLRLEENGELEAAETFFRNAVDVSSEVGSEVIQVISMICSVKCTAV